MKNFTLMALLLIVVLLAGCFDYEENLVLNADGSGSIQMKFSVEKTYLEQMKQMYEQMAQNMPDMEIPDDPKDVMFNKGKIEEALGAEDSGVKMVTYELTETDNSQVWLMKFTFEDTDDLDVLDKALSPDEDDEEEEDYDQGESHDNKQLMTKQDDGTWLFFRSFNDDDSDEERSDDDAEYFHGEYLAEQEEPEDDYYDEESESEMAEQLQEGLGQVVEGLDQMAEEMGKHKLRFTITFPGKVIESNASSVDGNTATWEYTLEQFETLKPEQNAKIGN